MTAAADLHGWKEIARYIGRSVRTAQRWERRGLPVHRVSAVAGAVYSRASEIDRWRVTEGHGEDPPLIEAVLVVTSTLRPGRYRVRLIDPEPPSSARATEAVNGNSTRPS